MKRILNIYTFLLLLFFYPFTSGLCQTAAEITQKASDSWNFVEHDPGKALDFARSAFKESTLYGLTSAAANSCSTIGYVQCSAGNFLAGYDTLYLCIALWRQVGDSVKVANIFNTIASFEKKQGNYVKALEHVLYATRLLELEYGSINLLKNNTKSQDILTRLSRTYLTQGALYDLQEMYTIALNTTIKGYQLAVKSKNEDLIADASLALANRYFQQKGNVIGYADSALLYYNKYIPNAYEGADLASAYHNLGRLALSRNPPDYSAVAEMLENGYLTVKEEENQLQQAEALFYLYDLDANKHISENGDYQTAFSLFSKAYALPCRKDVEMDMRLEFYKKYKECAAQIGDMKMAYQLAELERQIQDSLVNISNEKKMREIEKNEHEFKFSILMEKYQKLIGVALFLLFFALLLSIVWLLERSRRRLVIQNKVKSLTQKFLENQLHMERAKIAVTVHDKIGTPLSALAMLAEAITERLEPESKIKKIGMQLQEDLRKYAEFARTFSHTTGSLNQDDNTENDIVKYLKELEDLLSSANALKINFNKDLLENTTQELSSTAKAHLGIILQELIINTFKHAKAQHAYIHVEQNEGQLTFTYEDDGTNYKSGRRTGIVGGLSNIQQRITSLDGSILSNSPTVNGGFSIKFNIPVKSL